MAVDTHNVTVITGATAGIGRVAAGLLARDGGRLVLIGRDPGRGAAAVEQIGRETGNKKLDFIAADLSSMAEVHRAASEILSRHRRIDRLVNNAGAMYFNRQESTDGFEMTFALNHLAYFLMTNLLLPALERAGKARVVSVASQAHRMTPGLEFDDLQGKRRYQGWPAYQRSKLANVLFTRELARRTAGSGVETACLHPGFIDSSFGNNNKGPLGWLLWAAKKTAAEKVETGGERVAFLARAPEIENGGYYEKNQPSTPSPAAQSDEAARRLWVISAELTRPWLDRAA